jgi:hypothetical protein
LESREAERGHAEIAKLRHKHRAIEKQMGMDEPTAPRSDSWASHVQRVRQRVVTLVVTPMRPW